MLVIGGQYLVFDNLDFQGGWTAFGVYTANNYSHHITIQNCNLGYTSKIGLSIKGSGGSDNVQADHITVHDCNIISGAPHQDGGYEQVYAGDGITVRSCDYFVAYNNTIADWGHSSIYLLGEQNSLAAGAVRHADIYNNYITGAYNYVRGYNVDGYFDGQVSYNDFHDNQIINTTIGSQVNGDHNTFANNLIDGIIQPTWKDYGCAYGVSLQGYASIVHDNVISGNIIRNVDGPGIQVAGWGADKNLVNNTISGNTITNAGRSSRFLHMNVGLYVGDQACVLNNTYTGNSISPAKPVYFRSGPELTVPQFSAKNGTAGDVILGNT